MRRTARLSFDTQAFSHNLNIVKQHANTSRVMAVIKANAYGHGVLPAATALQQADAFAVACVDEAIYLREQNINHEIVVLQGFHNQQQLELCVQYQLMPVVHQPWQVYLILAMNECISVWLKFDSGMNRLGLTQQEFAEAYKQLSDCTHVDEVRVMSHLANADLPDSDPNREQLARFDVVINSVAELKDAVSLANSAAILTSPNTNYDWVRPGLMLYGASPIAGITAQAFNLKPVMRLATDVIAVKKVRAGESVGYGSSWTASSDSEIAVCAIGYADGYPRHAVSGTPVSINGREYGLAGRVSMDMICVDIGLKSGIQAGDEAVLWGPELPVERIAEAAETIPYELLCHAGSII